MLRIVDFIQTLIADGLLYIRGAYSDDDQGKMVVGTLQHYDFHPVKNDNCLVFNTSQRGEKISFGVLAQTILDAGDTQITSYSDPDTVAATVLLKNDGVLTIKNKDVTLELAASGDVVITNGAGTNTIKSDGSVSFANGASCTVDGDFVTKAGVSLNSHGHIGNFGSPLPSPLVSNLPTSSASIPSGEISTGTGITSVYSPNFRTSSTDFNQLTVKVNTHIHSVPQGGVTSEPL